MDSTTPPNPPLTKDSLILEWTAPARPYRARTREFYTTVLAIAFLLGVILILLKEFLLIGVIIAFAFLSYVLSTYRPEDVTHQLTTHGLKTGGKLYPWDGLINFWLKTQSGHETLFVTTKARIPGAVILLLTPTKRDAIIKALSEHLPQVEYQPGFVDRAGKWLGDRVPLENT